MNRISLCGLLSLAAAAACGCIPDNRYRTILDQNDMLRQTNEGLKVENDRLKIAVDTLKLMRQQVEIKSEADSAKLAATQAAFDNLSDKMKEFLNDQVKVVGPDSVVEFNAARNVITIKDAGLFESGKAEIRKDGERILRQLAEGLNGEVAKGRHLRICGHTDDQPVVLHKDVYPSNWHLSGARALNVLLFLEKAGVDSSALSFAGFGEHEPRAGNAPGRKGNKLNRRVEIAILGDPDAAVLPDEPGS